MNTSYRRKLIKHTPICKIAITGNVSMGKSYALTTIHKVFNLPIMSSDVAVSRILEKNNVINAIASRFGNSVLSYDQDNKKIINKKALADIIFSFKKYQIHNNKNHNNEEFKFKTSLETLEDIIHPDVYKSRLKFVQRCTRLKIKICVIEVPLLFEKKLCNEFNKIITVYSPCFIQLKRLNNSGKNINIPKFQMNIKKKILKSDFTIFNLSKIPKWLNSFKKISLDS